MLTNQLRERCENGKSAASRRRYTRALHHTLEILEPRHLLSVDLTGAFLTEPTSLFSGAKQAVTVNVSNIGDTKAAGSLSIAYYAALDGQTFDPNTALPVGRVTKSVSLAAGASLTVNYTVALGASLSAGTYRLYAVLDPNNKFVESDKSNNVAQSSPFVVAQPDYNLVTAFDPKTTLPPAVVDGRQSNASVRVVIANSSGGTATLPSGQKVAVQVVARPDGVLDDSQDVLLNRSVTLANVGSLKPGQSRTLSIAIRFPDSLADGTYDIIVKVDTGNALAETNEDDNQAAFDQTVLVAPPFSDPMLAFNTATTIPADVVADGRALPLKLDVTNLGNVKIPSGQTTSIAIIAHSLSTSLDTTLQTFTVSLTGLGVGSAKTLKFSPPILAALADGDYQIQALLITTTPGDVLINNPASSAATMNVGPAFYNLAVPAPSTSFSPSVVQGTAAAATVSVQVKNLSNTLIPAGTLAGITVALRPAGANSPDNDIPIGALAQASLGNLALGATKTFRVSSTIPATVAGGAYQIVATVTPLNLDEASLDNNTALGPTITVAPSFLDLAITSATEKFPTPAAAGSSAVGTVVIRNVGNQPFQGNVTVQFYASAQGTVTSFLIGSGTFLVTLQPGQSSFTLASALTLNLPSYAATARSASVQARLALNDANLADNFCNAGTVIISSQYVDLIVASATNPFSGDLPAGSTASANIVIGNIGSGTAIGPVTVSYYASLGDTLDGSQILLGSQTLSISLGGAQRTTYIPLTLTLPSPAIPTTYRILATLSADLTIDNNPSNNLTSVLGTVTVEPPPP